MLIPLFCLGCGGRGDFPLAPTSGRVLCEGKPVPNALVFFEPLRSGESALAGKQGLARTDEKGEFRVSTYGTDDGAVVGKHRVRVGAPDRESYPDFSCNCVLNPEIDVMNVEVKKGEENKFEIVLKTKTGREKPVLGG
jgi:hypothetical protein